MKYLYLLLVFLLVNSECPNLCSGHGSCQKNGVCECNRQPGLGINKGAFDEVIWTGADCSERMCPKGQSYTYYKLKGDKSYDNKAVNAQLKKLNTQTNPRRELFESDRELEGTEEATSEPSALTTLPPTTTAEPTTVAPTTPKPTTTSPPIMTTPPMTMPPTTVAPTLPEEVITKPLGAALEGVFDEENKEKIKSTTIACYYESGKFIGNMVITNQNETNVGDLLETLGVTVVNEDIYCGKIRIKREEETAPSTDLLGSFKDAIPEKKEFIKADGRKVKTEVVTIPVNNMPNSDKILQKLGLGSNRRRRMLDDSCGGITDAVGKFYCIESENPAESYFYRMKQTTVNIKCEGENGSKELKLSAPAEDISDIQGPCFFLGEVNTPIESSEIYSFVGQKGGDYYFGRYNNDVTTIVATEKDNDDNDYEDGEASTTIELELDKVPSLVPGSSRSYPYKDRPKGEIELALVKGATVEITPYVNGVFLETTRTTVKSFKLDSSSIKIESPINNPIKPGNSTGGSGDNNEDDGTGTDGSDSGRMLWEERELDDSKPIYILNILRTEGPHPFIECSGQGNCNRQTGQCECYEGFEGDACQRTSCPNNCNNNGRCVVLNEALGLYKGNSTTSSTTSTNSPSPTPTPGTDDEEPFDTKLYGCICDEGHRGADCSLYECPSDVDPKSATNTGPGGEYRDCSGRGLCDYTTGLCSCFEGYYGTACETAATLQ